MNQSNPAELKKKGCLVRVCMNKCACVCVSERERERVRVNLIVCVSERERESVRERE